MALDHGYLELLQKQEAALQARLSEIQSREEAARTAGEENQNREALAAERAALEAQLLQIQEAREQEQLRLEREAAVANFKEQDEAQRRRDEDLAKNMREMEHRDRLLQNVADQLETTTQQVEQYKTQATTLVPQDHPLLVPPPDLVTPAIIAAGAAAVLGKQLYEDAKEHIMEKLEPPDVAKDWTKELDDREKHIKEAGERGMAALMQTEVMQEAMLRDKAAFDAQREPENKEQIDKALQEKLTEMQQGIEKEREALKGQQEKDLAKEREERERLGTTVKEFDDRQAAQEAAQKVREEALKAERDAIAERAAAGDKENQQRDLDKLAQREILEKERAQLERAELVRERQRELERQREEERKRRESAERDR